MQKVDATSFRVFRVVLMFEGAVVSGFGITVEKRWQQSSHHMLFSQFSEENSPVRCV
jgi:hypothetical protein